MINEVNHQLHSVWQLLAQHTYNVLPNIITGLVIFVVAWIIAIVVKFCIIRLANRSKKHLYLYRILGSLAMGLILFAGLITALGTMGVNVGALVASLGLAGFAIGFALKDTLSNLMAGFIVLFYQPFKSGDFIIVNKVEGQVINVTLRYTVVKTDSEHTFIPNSVVLANPLTVKD